MNAKGKGLKGEQLAVDFLTDRGSNVLERNFRTRTGEIDIIAEKDNELSFIEVKSWTFNGFEDLEYSINSTKRKKIIQTSKAYMNRKSCDKYSFIHYDVVFIDTVGKIEYIKDAFTETNS